MRVLGRDKAEGSAVVKRVKVCKLSTDLAGVVYVRDRGEGE